MATRWTQTLIPTLRQDPSEAEVPSHRLMLRAGLIRQLSAGIYTYLPLGWRAQRKAIEIIRQATLVGARVVEQEGSLGIIEPGAIADLLLVDGDPLADLRLLTEQGAHLAAIMQSGRFVKRTL